MTVNSHQQCPICLIGRRQSRMRTFAKVYRGTLVSVPNTPAAVCDFCRTIEFDTSTIQRIETIVHQAGPPPNRPLARATPVLPRKAGPYRADGKP